MPGIPLIYSGDEVATLNNYNHHSDNSKKDGRWLHRTEFPWKDEHSFLDVNTYRGKVYTCVKKLIEIRQNEKLFNSKIEQKIINTNNNSVFVSYKTNLESSLYLIYNFSENHQTLDLSSLRAYGSSGIYSDLYQKKTVDFTDDSIDLYPYEFLWIKQN